MKLILVGPRASGKTQIGQHVAQKWQCAFSDLDETIEKISGKSPSQWIELDQESQFRQIEFIELKKWLGCGEGILATGGGTSILPEAQSLLMQFEPVIWLHNSPESRFTHLQKKPRPALKKGETLKEEIKRLDEERIPIYQKIANATVNTDEDPEAILERFQELRDRFDFTAQNTKK